MPKEAMDIANKMKKNARNESLDMVSGVMVLWMMIFHLFQWAEITDSLFYKTVLQWLFFFLPWFYFKSGMFFKPDSDNSIIEYTKKRVNAILYPLLIWFAIGYLIQWPELIIVYKRPLWKILVSPLYNFLRYGSTPGNNPLWFLFSLFFVQIVSFYVIRIRYYYIFVLLLLSAGILLEVHSIVLPLCATTIPLGLFFYIAGFLYSKYYIKCDLKYFIIVATPVFIVINSLFSSYVDIRLNTLIYGSYPGFLCMSIFAIIITIYFSKFFRSGFLVWAGQKSMYLLVLHWPVYYVIKIVYRFFRWSAVGYGFAWSLFILAFPACMITIKTLGPDRLLFRNSVDRIITDKAL